MLETQVDYEKLNHDVYGLFGVSFEICTDPTGPLITVAPFKANFLISSSPSSPGAPKLQHVRISGLKPNRHFGNDGCFQCTNDPVWANIERQKAPSDRTPNRTTSWYSVQHQYGSW